MHLFRHLVPALAGCHLCAITIASVPPPRDIVPTTSAAPIPDDWLAQRIGPALDGVAAAAGRTEHAWNASGPLRRVAGAYTRAIRLEQRWNMFAEPPDTSQYAHMRYYVRYSADAQGVRVDRELIFPARRGERVPFSGAAYYEEKAIRSARQRFYGRVRESPVVERIADLPRDLVPVVRYYTARYRRALPEGETIRRTELWLGSAPVPPPGARASEDVDRSEVLRTYYEGPQSTWGALTTQPVGTRERQADITWTLIYFQESS